MNKIDIYEDFGLINEFKAKTLRANPDSEETKEIIDNMIFSDKYRDFYDYTPLLERIGNIAIRIDQDDYQGDSWILYKEGNKYGYLNFGWGSCSGCDALQDCSNIFEVYELAKELESNTIWFDNDKEALDYFNSDARKMDYSWHYNEYKGFIIGTINLLKENTNENN